MVKFYSIYNVCNVCNVLLIAQPSNYWSGSSANTLANADVITEVELFSKYKR